MTAALAVAGAASAQQQNAQGPDAGSAGRARPQMTDADRSAFVDARIAGIKAGLKLTPDQEKLWPQAEQAIRDAAKARAERFAQRREKRADARANPEDRPDLIQRMRGGAERMTENAATVSKLADGIEPLYKTLDEAQKRRLSVLIRSGMQQRKFAGHFGHWRQGAE
jgi:hypothetical protein